MLLLKWDERYSVRIPGIDADHREIFEMLNELHQKRQGQPGLVTATASDLDRLDEYARRHFQREELLMRVRGYPGYKEHKAEHEAYVDKVARLRERLPDTYGDTANRIINFMKDWWRGHILESDQGYAKYFSASAKASSP